MAPEQRLLCAFYPLPSILATQVATTLPALSLNSCGNLVTGVLLETRSDRQHRSPVGRCSHIFWTATLLELDVQGSESPQE
ncbi:hypothetical protein B0T18DRAFT_44595 [Schizothecium vesticola]|uniref:Uncharacterized protein n=1 Tax=Schizothecium vesticola TaxID=314040 RepID=A0AA40FBN3_9PEZI|nr:hypothetical protein B0T18DRAFT_44595 [Schizothecium vesticola]